VKNITVILDGWPNLTGFALDMSVAVVWWLGITSCFICARRETLFIMAVRLWRFLEEKGPADHRPALRHWLSWGLGCWL